MAKMFMCKGREMSLSKMAQLPECKLTYNALYFRVVKRGMSPEEAVNFDFGIEFKKYLWKGQYLSSWMIAKDEDAQVSRDTIELRLSKGWNLADAVLTPANESPVLNRRKRTAAEKERFKKIMSVPVNPAKCRYTAAGILK